MPHPTAMLADASLVQSLAIGLVIAGVIILGYSFRFALANPIRRLLSARPASRRPVAPASPSHSAAASPSDLNAVMNDAEELAQLISERIDRQAAHLEQLIAAADDRLARLERAMARAEESPVLHAAPQPVPPPRRENADPLTRQIYDLSDRGMPPIEIARQLNQHTGKIELILALRQRS